MAPARRSFGRQAPPAEPELSTSQPRERVYLQPGQLFASREPARITTVLGSCVAVCLFDPAVGVGGMNHYLLPHRTGNRDAGERFGSLAIPRLIERLTKLGAHGRRLTAKVFGGACVIGSRVAPGHLGAQNAELAFDILGEHGIEIAARDVGGRRGRKLIFYTDDGSAWTKLL